MKAPGGSALCITSFLLPQAFMGVYEVFSSLFFCLCFLFFKGGKKKKKGDVFVCHHMCAFWRWRWKKQQRQSRISSHETTAFDANLPPPEPTGVVFNRPGCKLRLVALKKVKFGFGSSLFGEIKRAASHLSINISSTHAHIRFRITWLAKGVGSN